jgi:uncharacterized membrane protein
MKKLTLFLGFAILILAACQDLPAPTAVERPDPAFHGIVSSSAVSYSAIQLDSMSSRTAGINDHGVVVGSHRAVLMGAVMRPLLWLPDGGRIMLEDFDEDASFAAISNSGTAIGWESDDRSSYFNTHRRGFLYADGEIVMVDGEHLGVDDEVGEFVYEGPLADDRVQPRDINDHGVVIARALFQYERPDGSKPWRRYAFAWQQGQPITYIFGGQPTAINNHGVVIGFGWGAVPVLWRPGSYDEPEVLTVLRSHFSGYEIELKDINDAGQIVGIACRRNDGRGLCDYLPENTTDRRGFVFDGGRVVELLTPHRTEFQNAYALNDQGQIAGEVRVRQGNRWIPEPVIWTLSGATVDYEQLPAPFSDFYHGSRVTSINSAAVAAGNSYPSSHSRAFVWRMGEGGGDPPPPSGDGPTASFTYRCQNTATCDFTDTSTAGGSAIGEWVWTSTAGHSASTQHTSFTFGQAGPNTVTLRVIDGSGQTNEASTTINCSMHQRHGLRCS